MNINILKELINKHGLTRAQVAKTCKVSIHTVNSWLAPAGSSNSRNCPDSAIEALNLK